VSLFEQIAVDPLLGIEETAAAGVAGARPQAPRPLDADRLGSFLRLGVEQANARVRRVIETNGWGVGGSTLVLAAVLGDTLIVINVGDSPLYHYCAATDSLERVSEDHSVAGVLVKAGLITSEMARVHEGRSQLKAYMGMPELPANLPVAMRALAPGDRLLLCSDGVSGRLSRNQIHTELGAAGQTLEFVAEALIAAAREAGETDNQTTVLWQHGTLR
jgi:protein phosphatase